MNKLDKILVFSLSALFFTVLFTALLDSLVYAIIISLLLSVLIRTVAVHFIHRKDSVRVISVGEMENEFAIMGKAQLDYFFDCAPSVFSPKKVDFGFVYTQNGMVNFVVPNYKFGLTSKDEVAKFFRKAKEIKADCVIVLGRQVTRDVLVLTTSLDIRFRFLPSKKLHKFLQNSNSLMPIRRKINNPKKPSVKTVFFGVFSRKRVKYFLFCGFSLLVFSLFSPLKAYYLATSGLCLVFAVICLIKKT